MIAFATKLRGFSQPQKPQDDLLPLVSKALGLETLECSML